MLEQSLCRYTGGLYSLILNVRRHPAYPLSLGCWQFLYPFSCLMLTVIRIVGHRQLLGNWNQAMSAGGLKVVKESCTNSLLNAGERLESAFHPLDG